MKLMKMKKMKIMKMKIMKIKIKMKIMKVGDDDGSRDESYDSRKK